MEVQTQLTEPQAALLAGILSEYQRIESIVPGRTIQYGNPGWAAALIAKQTLQAGYGVRIQAWGGIDAAARQRRHRHLKALCDMGLVELILATSGGRSTHVVLTEAGRTTAEGLIKDSRP